MDIQRLVTSLSLKIIVQFGIVLALSVLLISWHFDWIYRFYFENQQTNTGIIINGSIVALLIFGLANIVFHLFRYKREETALAGLVRNVESLKDDLSQGLPANSIVVKRQLIMRSIETAGGEINHSALAAMLGADENIQFGMMRFINNILILTGVFGTIVSLSIALLGASDLIDSSAASLGGMGLVIHGMSTALSTTITAIIAYLIFGYFYTRLNDVQIHFLSGVEHLTSVYLLPKFVKSNDDIVNKMSDLIKAVVFAADNMKLTQQTYHDAALTLQQTIVAHQLKVENISSEFESVRQLLREGFRLPTDDQAE
ncbi:MAG: hypothetical protein ACI9LO_000423 [Planctomycetota bacterium]|jgi:hypothetical protein